MEKERIKRDSLAYTLDTIAERRFHIQITQVDKQNKKRDSITYVQDTVSERRFNLQIKQVDEQNKKRDSIDQLHFDKQIKYYIENMKNSMRPLIVVNIEYSSTSAKQGFSIRNNGLGPAIITNIYYFYDNIPYKICYIGDMSSKQNVYFLINPIDSIWCLSTLGTISLASEMNMDLFYTSRRNILNPDHWDTFVHKTNIAIKYFFG